MSLDLSALKKYGEIPRQIRPFLDKYKEVGESYDEIETVINNHRERRSHMSLKGANTTFGNYKTIFSMDHSGDIGHFLSVELNIGGGKITDFFHAFESKNDFEHLMKRADIYDEEKTIYGLEYREINNISDKSPYITKTESLENSLEIFERLLRQAIEYNFNA